MPRNVRNFWVDAHIDGREGVLSGGPRAKDGGMDLSFFVREGGEVREVFEVIARRVGDTDKLRVIVRFNRNLTIGHTINDVSQDPEVRVEVTR